MSKRQKWKNPGITDPGLQFKHTTCVLCVKHSLNTQCEAKIPGLQKSSFYRDPQGAGVQLTPMPPLSPGQHPEPDSDIKLYIQLLTLCPFTTKNLSVNLLHCKL